VFDLNLPIPAQQLERLALAASGGDHVLAREAAQQVRVQLWRGLFDPARGSFAAWSRTVLARFCLDDWKRRRRVGGHESALLAADPSDGTKAVEFALDLADPFGPDDVAAIRRWSPRQRVVLLWWFGLWGKLPAEERRSALARLGVPADAAPPPDFEGWSAADRITHLVGLLGGRRNDIAQTCCRDRGKVAALAFTRQLRGW